MPASGCCSSPLERLGRADDTLVILTGDHGPPFDRGKTTVYEAGLRVPFLVRWPGVSKPARSQAMVSTVDILPTILDATGVPAAVEMQGMSLRPVLENAEAAWREYLVGEFHMHGAPWFPRRAIRDGRFKLIHNLLAPTASPSIRIDGDLGYLASRDESYAGTPIRQAFDTFANPPEFELYDLEADPWEFRNLSGDPEHAEALQRLQAALEEWRRETADPVAGPGLRRGDAPARGRLLTPCLSGTAVEQLVSAAVAVRNCCECLSDPASSRPKWPGSLPKLGPISPEAGMRRDDGG